MCTQTCATIDKIWEDGEGGMQFFVVVGADETVEKLKASDERAPSQRTRENNRRTPTTPSWHANTHVGGNPSDFSEVRIFHFSIGWLVRVPARSGGN